ncbi:MAG: nucleoside 2-deoxyribosyltransferase [Candidatus Absconditabacterales bacterium]
MKTVVLSGSMKFIQDIQNTLHSLQELGAQAQFPNGDNIVSGEDLSMEQSKQLALEHYEAIKQSDIVYFLTPNGYMGTSCKVELGYAIALNKTIIFSELTHDIALDCYAQQIIPLDNLLLFQSL